MAVRYTLRAGTTGPVVLGVDAGDVLIWDGTHWVPGAAGGAGPRVGWDQPPATILVAANLVGSIPFPRDVELEPLEVFFAAVTEGNQLEVTWQMTLGNITDAGDCEFTAIAAVTFGDNVFPADWFIIANSQGGTRIAPAVGPLQSDVQYNTMGGFASVTIPEGATLARVWLLYHATRDVIAGGVNLGGFVPGASCTLRAIEYPAASVPQPGPGTLVPLGE